MGSWVSRGGRPQFLTLSWH